MLRPRIHCLRFRAPREKGRELPTVPRWRARARARLERERKVHQRRWPTGRYIGALTAG